jgi:hypothetical protein
MSQLTGGSSEASVLEPDESKLNVSKPDVSKPNLSERTSDPSRSRYRDGHEVFRT